MNLAYMIDGVFSKAIHTKLQISAKIFMAASAHITGMAIFCIINHNLIAFVVAISFCFVPCLFYDPRAFMTK